ncbi:hypothetical protein L599_003600000070 [Luteimonas sp. J16]|jgi:hypothetical protein|nr:hypothetical protein L599_003600000070 [Luteimonas sp. J16]
MSALALLVRRAAGPRPASAPPGTTRAADGGKAHAAPRQRAATPARRQRD